MKRELEHKWAVPSSSAFNAFLTALSSLTPLPKPEQIFNDDYYIDTPGRSLYLLNYICRIRLSGKTAEFTAKSTNKIVNGLANREERNYPLKHSKTYEEALLSLKEVFPFNNIKTEELVNLFRITNNRKLYALTLQGGLKVEIALDNAVIYSGGKEKELKEIECELLEGGTEHFIKFLQVLTQKSGLQPAETSKVATAAKMMESPR